MTNEGLPPEPSPSRGKRFKGWVGSLALLVGGVIAALVVAELGPVQGLCARIDAAQALHPGLIALPIVLMVAGGILMLGAQFLPAPRQPAASSYEALDAAVPMEVSEERERWSRSMKMEVSLEELREAWRRRSWRTSRNWRILFLMLIGAVLLSAGLALLFILIGPPWIKVLAAGLAAGVVVWILWAFAVS
jgi:hypothetical protein